MMCRRHDHKTKGPKEQGEKRVYLKLSLRVEKPEAGVHGGSFSKNTAKPSNKKNLRGKKWLEKKNGGSGNEENIRFQWDGLVLPKKTG